MDGHAQIHYRFEQSMARLGGVVPLLGEAGGGDQGGEEIAVGGREGWGGEGGEGGGEGRNCQ